MLWAQLSSNVGCWDGVMKWHCAQKGWITTNGRIIRGCWAEDPRGPMRQPEPGGHDVSFASGWGGPQSPTWPDPRAPSLHQRLLCPPLCTPPPSHHRPALFGVLPQDRVCSGPGMRRLVPALKHWVLPSSPCVPAWVSGLLKEIGVFSQFHHGHCRVPVSPLASLSAAHFSFPVSEYCPWLPLHMSRPWPAPTLCYCVQEPLLTIPLDPCLMFIYPHSIDADMWRN